MPDFMDEIAAKRAEIIKALSAELDGDVEEWLLEMGYANDQELIEAWELGQVG